MGPSVWLIAGPTASGKSALALRLAEAVGGEVVNADALQLYADLSVLSARPSPGETARAPHHLYGVADAADGWSVGRWARAAEGGLADIHARGRPAIVVGGTGLYFRALERGLAEVPPVPDAVRQAVTQAYETEGEAATRRALGAVDPGAAARIAPGDRQRLIRALSVARATGRSLSDWTAQPARPVLAPADIAARVVLAPPRAALYARCDARLEAMVEAGAFGEVERLVARDLNADTPAMKAVGVREFAAHLAGALSLDAALDAARRETRRYAKRQETWFRNQTPDWPRIDTLDPDAQWTALRGLAGLRGA